MLMNWTKEDYEWRDSKTFEQIIDQWANFCTPVSFAFAILKNNGINRFAEKVKNELNEELEHANKLAERILLFKGVPNFQDTNEISKHDGKFTKDTIRKILEANLKLEGKGIKDIKETISIAEKEKDFVSVMLLEEMLKMKKSTSIGLKNRLTLLN